VSAAPCFLFVQFEFTHAIGPHAGSYVVVNAAHTDEHGAAIRAENLPTRETLTGVTMKPSTADVLAITVSGAPAQRRGIRRRSHEEQSAEPDAKEVPLLLATFVRATEPFGDEAEVSRALDIAASDEDTQQEWVGEGLRVLNRAIRGYRAGSRDPYVTEVGQRDARAVRVGYGTHEDIAAGRWRRAVTLPPPVGIKASRTERLAPTQVTADALSGRDELLEGEDVLLRAYVDLDHDRELAAAAQVRAAIAVLRSELGDEHLQAIADRAERAASADELLVLLTDVERVIERWRIQSASRRT
jgi:hypothetical protein